MAEVRRLKPAYEITSASNSVRQALPCTERSFASLQRRKDTALVVNLVRFLKGNKVSGVIYRRYEAFLILIVTEISIKTTNSALFAS